MQFVPKHSIVGLNQLPACSDASRHRASKLWRSVAGVEAGTKHFGETQPERGLHLDRTLL